MKKIIAGLVLIGLVIFHGMGLMGMVEAKDGMEKALIVVDPGKSGFSLKVAEKIAEKLSAKGMQVNLVKAKALTANDLSDIDLLVMGGPTYAQKPSKKLTKAMTIVNKPGINTILFQTGGSDCSGLITLIETAKSKGLNVVASDGILCNKREDSYVDNKIDELLEKI